ISISLVKAVVKDYGKILEVGNFYQWSLKESWIGGLASNKASIYVLVKWVNHDEEDATWELVDDLIKRFSEFSLDP
ncbi:reverse transcriptase, partial [Tanacetum coccineum]